jgi:hypothetical protein
VYRNEECKYGLVIVQQRFSDSGTSTPTSPKAPVTVGRPDTNAGTRSASISPDISESVTEIEYRDMPLFDHYLRHTCHAAGLSADYAYARRIGLPTLASKSRGVLCSILAFGAACLCTDILCSKTPAAAIDYLYRLIRTADRYHGLALASIRAQLNSKDPDEVETAHAHAAMLTGYAPARRRIFRLLRAQGLGGTMLNREPDADAPHNLDWAVFFRGLNTVASLRDSSWYGQKLIETSDLTTSDKPDGVWSAYVAEAIALEKDQVDRLVPDNISSSISSGIESIIFSAIPKALSTLYAQIDILRLHILAEQLHDSEQLQALLSCYSAISMLEATANEIGTICQLQRAESASPGTISTRRHLEAWFTTHTPSWLHDFRAPEAVGNPSGSVMRSLFRWISRIPATFFTLLLTKSLDKRTLDALMPLTTNQQVSCLAWDIYAHWLVLTFLMENELWWWADLGHTDIEKLRSSLPKPDENGYSVSANCHNWWPWQMWTLAKELRSPGGE